MVATESQIKLLYVKEALYQHGDYLMDILSEAIEGKRLRRKDDLLNSLSYEVKEDFAGRMVLYVSFIGYGRAIEIRYHKSKNQQALAVQRRNDIWKTGQLRMKNTRWYSRNVYGSINRLLGYLQSEFSENERARLKYLLETELNMTTLKRTPKL